MCYTTYSPLTELCNICLSTTSIPSEWKSHLIWSFWSSKAGDHCLVTNYRPTSQLCLTLEVLERLIYCGIISFLHPKISNYQFGFMSNRSCLHKLLLFLSNFVQALDNKTQLDVINLDLQQSVQHCQPCTMPYYCSSLQHCHWVYVVPYTWMVSELSHWQGPQSFSQFHCTSGNLPAGLGYLRTVF